MYFPNMYYIFTYLGNSNIGWMIGTVVGVLVFVIMVVVVVILVIK